MRAKRRRAQVASSICRVAERSGGHTFERPFRKLTSTFAYTFNDDTSIICHTQTLDLSPRTFRNCGTCHCGTCPSCACGSSTEARCGANCAHQCSDRLRPGGGTSGRPRPGPFAWWWSGWLPTRTRTTTPLRPILLIIVLLASIQPTASNRDAARLYEDLLADYNKLVTDDFPFFFIHYSVIFFLFLFYLLSFSVCDVPIE